MGGADEPVAIRRRAPRGLSTALAALLTGCAAVAPPPSQPADAAAAMSVGAPDFTLDTTHTFVHWEVLHMGTSTHRGRFDKVNGSVQFDAATQRLGVSISVETASVRDRKSVV